MRLIIESFEVGQREEITLDILNTDKIKRLIADFCEKYGVKKCTYIVRGEAEVNEIKEGELFCLFG